MFIFYPLKEFKTNQWWKIQLVIPYILLCHKSYETLVIYQTIFKELQVLTSNTKGLIESIHILSFCFHP
jgi:hypothetical protein